MSHFGYFAVFDEEGDDVFIDEDEKDDYDLFFISIEDIKQAFTINGISLPYPVNLSNASIPEFEPESFDGCNSPTATEKPLSHTERAKLLELLLGMAMDSYGYDPSANKNKATGYNNGSISAALSRCGLSADPDTVRKYLAEAASLFPHAKPLKS